MTCAQGLLRLLWGGARSWSATGLLLELPNQAALTSSDALSVDYRSKKAKFLLKMAFLYSIP